MNLGTTLDQTTTNGRPRLLAAAAVRALPRPPGVVRSRLGGALAVLASLFLVWAPASASAQDWIKQELNLQEDLDRDAPMAHTTWIGTHNSYNSHQDGYFIDPNQFLSLTNQLRKGVRVFVFDVHAIDFLPTPGGVALNTAALD